MPAFSGKQKKAYLQEKRAKKKLKKPLGADTSSDSDASDDHYNFLHGGGGGAKDKDTNTPHKDHESNGRGGGRGARGGRGRGGGRGGENAKNDENNSKITESTDVYGGDKKGVRSEFKKEHRRDIKERQKANYAPLLEREFIDADKGIAFGKWFKVGNLSEGRQYDTVVDGVLMGQGGYSSTFLYSIALPRRARMSGEDGTDIFADPADDSDDNGQGPMRGPRRGGIGRSTGRGGGGRKTNLNEITDSTTTSSSSSSSDREEEEEEEEAEDEVETSNEGGESDATKKEGNAAGSKGDEDLNTNTKAGLKSLKARLQAATAYDARERHVFRHWMNRIDEAFGATHDARRQYSQEQETENNHSQQRKKEGKEESEEDNEKKDGEDEESEILQKERRIGRRHRAVDKANSKGTTDQQATAPPPHPLAHLELNLFERNIDVWRQLWRTVENSDVVVAVADARYPIVHLPTSLFRHVFGECRKPIVVVLNKVDLMKESMLKHWEGFLRHYWDKALKPFLPEELHYLVDEIEICRFTCSPEAGTALAKGDEKATSRRKKKGPRNAKLYEELKAGESKKGQSAYGPSRREQKGKLFDYAAEAKRARQARREAAGAHSASDSDAASDSDDSDSEDEEKQRKERDEHLRKELAIVKQMIDTILYQCRRKGFSIKRGDTTTPLPPIGEETRPIHIGFIGHPNVGKSSLINCIRGSKVVSVSATAGHTKHLQTVPLLSDGVVLIDCPGLAFPALGLPKPMQAVLGTHQIAQTRDPQSGVGYLAARLCLERIYGLRKLNYSSTDAEEPWSAYELCESYGHKKGYHVKKGKGAIDVHRAAIALLQEAYDGRLILSFAPPPTGYLSSEAFTKTVSRFLYLDPEHLDV